MTDADYGDDLLILSDSTDGAVKPLQNLEEAVANVCLYVNAKKTKFMQCNCNGNIETTFKLPLESVDSFTYLGHNTESPEKGNNIKIEKA